MNFAFPRSTDDKQYQVSNFRAEFDNDSLQIIDDIETFKLLGCDFIPRRCNVDYDFDQGSLFDDKRIMQQRTGDETYENEPRNVNSRETLALQRPSKFGELLVENVGETRQIQTESKAVKQEGMSSFRVSNQQNLGKRISNEEIFVHENEVNSLIVCDVCGDGEDYQYENSQDGTITEDQVVLCDGCNVAVHQSCYGRKLLDQIPEGDWLCERCEQKEKGKSLHSMRCFLCLQMKGLIRYDKNHNTWAHINCVNYDQAMFYEDQTEKSRIVGVIDPKRQTLKCEICKNRKYKQLKMRGYCIQCDEKNCTKSFHVRCAIQKKLIGNWMEVDELNKEHCDEEAASIFCFAHKRKAKIRKSRINSNNQAQNDVNQQQEQEEGQIDLDNQIFEESTLHQKEIEESEFTQKRFESSINSDEEFNINDEKPKRVIKKQNTRYRIGKDSIPKMGINTDFAKLQKMLKQDQAYPVIAPAPTSIREAALIPIIQAEFQATDGVKKKVHRAHKSKKPFKVPDYNNIYDKEQYLQGNHQPYFMNDKAQVNGFQPQPLFQPVLPPSWPGQINKDKQPTPNQNEMDKSNCMQQRPMPFNFQPYPPYYTSLMARPPQQYPQFYPQNFMPNLGYPYPPQMPAPNHLANNALEMPMSFGEPGKLYQFVDDKLQHELGSRPRKREDLWNEFKQYALDNGLVGSDMRSINFQQHWYFKGALQNVSLNDLFQKGLNFLWNEA